MGDPKDGTAFYDAGAVYVMDVSGADADGDGVTDGCQSLYTSVCSASTVPNSTGAPAVMTATGSPYVDDQNLTVRVEDLPLQTFGLLVASTTAGFTQNPGGSQGNLCLGGTLGRFNAQVTSSGADGVIEVPVDLDDLPAPLPSAVAPGDTWRFQLRYRDANPSATSNFSDAIRIPFL